MNGSVVRPSMVHTLTLVAAYGARQIAWSRRTFVIVALLLIPALLAGIIRANSPPGIMDKFLVDVLPSLHLGLAAIVALFFGSSMVRDGLEDHTLTYLLTRPLGRKRVTLGLYLGLVAVLMPLVVGSVVVSVLTSFTGFAESNAERLDAALSLGATVGGSVLVYSAFFIMFGMVFSRPTILGVVWLLIADMFFGFWDRVRWFSISSYLESTFSPTLTTRPNDESLGLGASIVVLGLILVASLSLACWRASTRNYIVSDEDS